MLYTCIVNSHVFASQSNEYKLNARVTSILNVGTMVLRVLRDPTMCCPKIFLKVICV